jgi:hypothetical protein
MPLTELASDQLKLVAGAAMLYAAGRAGSRVAKGNQHGFRAVCSWIPIAALTVGAVLLHEQGVALAVIFATTVGSLSLVAGCVGIMGETKDEPPQWPAPARRVATLLLPTALLAFLAGFSGYLDYFSAVILGIEGIILLAVWRERDPDGLQQKGTKGGIPATRLLAALILSIAGAWTVLHGMIGLGRNMDFLPLGVASTIALCPLLVAPMLLGGSELSQAGRAWAASMTQIGVAQLNLCALLPLTAVLWRLRWGEALYYPVANWRVDAVVIVLLSAALLPAASARWRPGRLEGAAQLLVYVAYVLAVIFVAGRTAFWP